MRIKKLEISGFKSFSDRTVLTFEEGLSAIVGPNGCGKSNIVDAVRWVMGEQSARMLRGRSMEDLIFGGSDTRGAVGMAEVTMTLDLTIGTVPARYVDYSEIQVTRRAFRDGTSEYFIQKVPCRLKDIADIFVGTGAHSRAYSIIEQAKIGFIVTAKPEERRTVIEEAAGITRYKSRKKSAERRMESTRQNLLRVSDIVAEIERRLRSLKRQARKAERYEMYSTEHRDLDLWRTAHEFLGLTTARKVVAEKLSDLSRERAEVENTVQAAEARLEAHRLDLAQAETDLATVQEKVYEVDNKIKLLESQAGFKKQEKTRLEADGKRADEEIHRLEQDLEDLVARIAQEREHLDTLKQDSGERGMVLEIRREEHEGLREELTAVGRELSELRARKAEFATEIAASQGRTAAWQGRRLDLLSRVEQIVAERKELETRVEGARRDQERLEQSMEDRHDSMEELEVRRKHVEERSAELADQIQHGEIQLETVRTQLHRCRSRLSSLEEIQRRYEGFEQGTKAIMERREQQWRGVRGLVADIVSSPAELESAVEAALGDRLGNVLVDSQQVGVEAVEYLKRDRRGRSSFIPLDVRSRGGRNRNAHGSGDGIRGSLLDMVDVSSEYRGVAEYLLGDVLVAENLASAIGTWQRTHTPLVTLDGEVVDAFGAITGGMGAEDRSSGILGQKREIRELAEMAVELEKAEQESLASLMALKHEQSTIASELELVVRQTHSAEMAQLDIQKDLDRIRSGLEEASRRMATLLAEEERARRALDQEGHEVSESVVDAERKRQMLDGIEEQIVALGNRSEELARLVEEAGAALTELKVEVAQNRERFSAAHAALDRDERAESQMRQRLADLARQVEQGRSRSVELAEEIAAATAEAARLAANSKELDDALLGARNKVEGLRTTVTDLELTLKKARDRLSTLVKDTTDRELSAQKLDMDLEHLEREVRQRHDEDLESLLVDFHLRPLWGEEQQHQLDGLEEMLNRMRQDYNPTARKEFQELTERHAFLSEQRQDLEDALERLSKAIRKINKTSRVRFKEAFDAINERFEKVFPRLFGGGKAKLVLTEEDNLLESGVEIVAQAPGKKLQPVELLSGGEKALAAVSLVFSVFLYHPSPFCILDEVDAPLDDVNVDRVNEMIREMSMFTQFLLITHNKRTMEICDALFGVTMDEPGVSKVVQVDLRRAAELAA